MYALTKMERYSINLNELANGEGRALLHLDDAFFSSFENDDLKGGDVDVAIKVTKSQESQYDFNVFFSIKGSLRVICTRCLDEMDLDTEVTDKIKVIRGNSDVDNSDDDDLLQAEADGTLDIANRIFETLALNVPAIHVHPEGKCNPQMVEWLESHKANM